MDLPRDTRLDRSAEIAYSATRKISAIGDRFWIHDEIGRCTIPTRVSPYRLTYGTLHQLLSVAEKLYEVRPLAEAANWKRPSALPRLYLRHDIDLDLTAAVRMAELEHQLGVRATYMVMLTSPFYRLEEKKSRRQLQRLLNLGHEVSLHLDLDVAATRVGDLEASIHSAARRLEGIVGERVRSVSFHRPVPSLIRGPFHCAGLVNAYAGPLMERYYSDSRGEWRHGDPLPLLREVGTAPVQLLIHPIWWNDEHLAPADTLEAFFLRITSGMTPWDRQFASEALASHLTIQRTGLSTGETDDPARPVRHGRDSALTTHSIP